MKVTPAVHKFHEVHAEMIRTDTTIDHSQMNMEQVHHERPMALDNATDHRRSSLLDLGYGAEKHCKILLFPKPKEGDRTKPFQQPRVIEAALSLDSFCQ